MEFVPPYSSDQYRRHYRVLHPQWIDIRTIHGWVDYCDSHHDGHCHNLSAWNSVKYPSRVTFIDVQSSCLVKTSGSTRWLSLSYVWGHDVPSLESTRQNVSELFKPGSLDRSEARRLLPKTIRDAISLTKALEIRFLWVDRLCIVLPTHQSYALK